MSIVKMVGSQSELQYPTVGYGYPSVYGTGRYEDEVVITGLAGRLPNGRESVHEWSKYLFSTTKQDGLPTYHKGGEEHPSFGFEKSWKEYGYPTITPTDQTMELLVKVTWEAVRDAGLTPTDIKGTRTGVFIGKWSEEVTGRDIYTDRTGVYGDVYPTHTYPMELAKHLGTTGPYQIIDTPVTTPQALIALDYAVNAIKTGLCDMAIVVGMTYKPKDMYGNVDGVLLVEKKKYGDEQKTFYTKIVHSKVDFDTKWKSTDETGSVVRFEKFIRDTYADSKVDPNKIKYLETEWCWHGWQDEVKKEKLNEWSIVGDALAKLRDGKTTEPFYMGTLKKDVYGPSNGIYSLVKMLLSVKKGWLPPNTEYYTTKWDDKYKVLDKYVRYDGSEDGGLWAFSVYGPTFVHFVFEPYRTVESYRGGEWDSDVMLKFAFMTGPTEEYLHNWFGRLYRGEIEHDRMYMPTDRHPYRGYTLWNGMKKYVEVKKLSTQIDDKRSPIWFYFAGEGDVTYGGDKLKEMIKIEPFRHSFMKSVEYMKPYGLDLLKWFDEKFYSGKGKEYYLYKSIIIPAIQIALVDVLKTIGIVADGYVGHSFGELVAAYMDCVLKHDEVLLATLFRVKHFQETMYPETMSLVVGLPYKELIKLITPDLTISHHTSMEWCTVTGPIETVKYFEKEMKCRNVYVKEDLTVNTEEEPLHTPHMELSVNNYKYKLEKFLRGGAKTNHWYTTTVPEHQWSMYRTITPDYFVKNLTNPVYFFDAVKYMPKNAIAIEIGPFDVLKTVLTKHYGIEKYINLFKMDDKLDSDFGYLHHFLTGLGSLYVEGVDFDWRKLWLPKYEQIKTVVLPKQLTGSYVDLYGKQQKYTGDYEDNIWGKFKPITKPDYDEKSKYQMERVDFVPYYEELKDNQTQYYMPIDEYQHYYGKFNEYMDTVKYYMKKIFDKYRGGEEYVGQKWNVETEFRDTGKLLEYLKDLFVNEQKLKHGDLLKAWYEDKYLNYTRDYYLKTLIDTVYENLYDVKKLKILEIFGGSAFSLIGGSKIFKLLPTTEYEYYFAPTDGGIYDEQLWTEEAKRGDYKMHIVKGLDWNRLNEFPTHLYKDFDLVILNGVVFPTSFDGNMFPKWFMESILKPNGFVLVHEYKKEHETFKWLEHLVKSGGYNKTTGPSGVGPLVDVPYWGTGYDWKKWLEPSGYYTVSHKIDPKLSSFYLYRKPHQFYTHTKMYKDYEIYMDEYEDVGVGKPYGWMDKLKYALNIPELHRIWLISEKQPTSGIIGLVKKIRENEKYGDRVRCIFITEPIKSTVPVYDEQTGRRPFNFDKIKRDDLVWNVYKYGTWGSYKHFYGDWEEPKYTIDKSIGYEYVDFKGGNLTKPFWVKTLHGDYESLKTSNDDNVLVDVCYVGLHPNLVFEKNNELYGFEFSGLTNGKRIMGWKPILKNLSTIVPCNLKYVWEIPSEWSLKDAATVPLSYITAYNALFVRGQLLTGETVVIYNAASLFGQAAITIALQHHCRIYAFVNTKQEWDELQSRYPQIDVKWVDEAKNTIIDADLVLHQQNSFVKASRARHIVYGDESKPFDIIGLFDEKNFGLWTKIHEYIDDGMKYGFIKPLKAKIFDRLQLEDAFTYMRTYEKSVDKVLIKVWDPKYGMMKTGTEKLTFSPYKTYILVNGINGLGLELAHWMASRGARKFLFTTKFGMRTEYQQNKLKQLECEYGALVQVGFYDFRSERDCEKMFYDARQLSDDKTIGGVFYLSYMADDTLTWRMPVEERCHTLIEDIVNLDKYSRSMMPNDSYFVVFSPLFTDVSFDKLTKHHLDAYALSKIERLFEERRQKYGKHALVIQSNHMHTMYEHEFYNNTWKTNGFFDTLEQILVRSKDATTTTTSWSSVLCKNETFPQMHEMVGDLFQKKFMDLPLKKNLWEPVEDLTLSLSSLKPYGTQFKSIPSLYDSHQTTQKYNYLMPKKVFEKLNEYGNWYDREKKIGSWDSTPLFIIHPIEGHVNMLKEFAKHITVPVYGVQFTSEAIKFNTIEELADYYWSCIQKEFPGLKKIHLCGYTFGASVAFEMSLKRPETVHSLTFLDGNYKYQTKNFGSLSVGMPTDSEWLFDYITQYCMVESIGELWSTLVKIQYPEDRIKYAVKFLLTKSKFNFEPYDIEDAVRSYIKKMQMSYRYEPRSHLKLNEILVVLPTQTIKEHDLDGLTKWFDGRFIYKTIDCDKRQFLSSKYGYDIATLVNDRLMKF